MSTIVIACSTIKNELSLAMQETGTNYPVFYVESGLHNFPNLLMKRLQETIDMVEEDVDTILLAFGFCGNSLIGLSAPHASLIIPRADDCISLLLGSYEMRKNISAEMGTYFLTKGWLDNEQNLLTEYNRSIEKYGLARASRVFKAMLNHYKRLMLIDTNTYDLAEVTERTENFAKTMGIEHDTIEGSSRFLKKLLQGPWDEEFVQVKPGEIVTIEHMRINESSSNDQNLFGFNP